jgi:molybdopterin synthase catalytic subunit
MEIETIVSRIKSRPDFDRAGMLLVHNGVVRNCARDGRRVTGLTVKVDHQRLADVLRVHRALPGIVDIQVSIEEGRFLAVGEDVMVLAVAGDIRENVIAVLSRTLDAIKSTVTTKTEFFASSPGESHSATREEPAC